MNLSILLVPCRALPDRQYSVGAAAIATCTTCHHRVLFRKHMESTLLLQMDTRTATIAQGRVVMHPQRTRQVYLPTQGT